MQADEMMDKYSAIMQAEKVHATLLSISRGDSCATDECALFISETTLDELVESSKLLKQYVLQSIKKEDEIYNG